MVWLYIIGWSTYGPEAAATFAPAQQVPAEPAAAATPEEVRRTFRVSVRTAESAARDKDHFSLTLANGERVCLMTEPQDLARDLDHPALGALKGWFDRHVPQAWRGTLGS